MLKQISSSVFCWSEIHGAARNEPYLWNSYVIHVKDDHVLALVDPLAMTDEEIQEIERFCNPTYILLTCEMHVRETQRYRDKWGCQVLTLEEGIENFEIPIDKTFHSGDQLWNLITTIYVPDVYYPETAFLVQGDKNVLIVGDLFAGGRLDKGIPDGELALIGPEHISDFLITRKSLYRLLGYHFEVMCFAHGTPVFDNPKDKLKQYLDSDHIWDTLESIKQQREPKVTE